MFSPLTGVLLGRALGQGLALLWYKFRDAMQYKKASSPSASTPACVVFYDKSLIRGLEHNDNQFDRRS
jgi:hypothetical protein